MNRKKIIWISIAVIILLLLWLLFIRKKSEPVVFRTEKPERGYIAETVTATGTVQPVDTTIVGTRVSGTIEEIHADFNDRVKKGQLLAVLDKSLLQATVDQDRAALSQAQSNLSYQQSNFRRQQMLFQSGSVSRAEYELAMNNFNAASASVKNARAQLNSALRNLSFANIYSPVDGVVLYRGVNAGQTVAASFNTPTLFVIARDITRMQVQAAVDEADIGNVRTGLRASFTVDAYMDEVFEGTVEEIRLRPNSSSNVVTYTTLISAPNKDQKLKPGMTANITVYTKEAEDALLIPAEALKFRPDSVVAEQYELRFAPKAGRKTRRPAEAASQFVYVWILDGKILTQKRIETGLNNNTEVQVLSGLSSRETLITGIASGSNGTGRTQQSSPFMPRRPGGGGRR